MRRRVVVCAFVLVAGLSLAGCSAGNTASASAGGSKVTAVATPTTSAEAPAGVDTSVEDAPMHTPKRGSSEREAILNVLREPVEQKLRQKVIFKVQTMNVKGDFAFVQAQPLTPKIDYSTTPYKEAVANGAFDDRVDALLHYGDGAWRVMTYDIGSTDVEYDGWDATYGAPSEIFGMQ